MMDGTQSGRVHQHPRADDHHRRHRRRDAGERRHGRDEAHPQPLQDRRSPPNRPTCAAASSCSSALAEQARREGLLALDAQLGEIDDEFTRKALQLVVDGTDPELVREILEAEIDGMAARHARGRRAVREGRRLRARRWASSAPSWASCTCSRTSPRPSTLGPSISAAFIATLMGVGSANVIFLPIANRLKALSADEVELRMLTLEGILSIQAGDNPRWCREADVLRAARRARGRREAPRSAAGVADRPRRPRRSVAAMRRRARQAAARRRDENEERWLLTYADMITLLMALFMVLFSISSVNISKYETLQQSLQAAFSGNILPGGRAIAQPGAARPRRTRRRPPSPRSCRSRRTSPSRPTPRLSQSAGRRSPPAPRKQEQQDFEQLKHQLDAYAAGARLRRASRRPSSTQRGLVIHVLTDDLLFASGPGDAEPARRRRCSARSPSCSTSTATTRSTSRATPTTCRSDGRSSRATGSSRPPRQHGRSLPRRPAASREHRLTAAGYADLHPIASNATAPGARATAGWRSCSTGIYPTLNPVRTRTRHEKEADHHPAGRRGRRGLRHQDLLAGQAGRRQATRSTVRSTCCPRSFTLNLTDGRYAKLTVGSSWPRARATAPTAGRVPPQRPPELGTLPAGAAVRDDHHQHVTDERSSSLLTDTGRAKLKRKILNQIKTQTDVKVTDILFTDVAVQ